MSTKSHCPVNHPEIKPQKVGVLIINLGTPDSTDYMGVRRYLSEFLSDQRVIDLPAIAWQPILQGIILTTRPKKSGHAYDLVWNKEKNESPLKTYTRSQCEKIRALMQKKHPDLEIEWGMRYGNPSTKSKIEVLRDKGCQRILLFALYPQYSATTTATAYDKAFAYLKTIKHQPAVRTAPPWHDHPDYIKTLSGSIETTLKSLDSKPDHIIASFHGLPERYLMEGDPYHCHCHKTSRLTREALNWDERKWTTTFQSRFGPAKWLQPYTEETVIKLAKDGVKHLAIASPAFVSECIETLEEIDIGLHETFLEHGGEKFSYIPCLNDTDPHIKLLSSLIETELGGWI
jgi:ferrochelatase